MFVRVGQAGVKKRFQLIFQFGFKLRQQGFCRNLIFLMGLEQQGEKRSACGKNRVAFFCAFRFMQAHRGFFFGKHIKVWRVELEVGFAFKQGMPAGGHLV